MLFLQILIISLASVQVIFWNRLTRTKQTEHYVRNGLVGNLFPFSCKVNEEILNDCLEAQSLLCGKSLCRAIDVWIDGNLHNHLFFRTQR